MSVLVGREEESTFCIAHFLLICFSTAHFCVSSLAVHLTFAASYSVSVCNLSVEVFGLLW